MAHPEKDPIYWLGKSAFETYKSCIKLEVADWDKLGRSTLMAWEAVALAVVSEHTRRWHDAQRAEIREAMSRLPVIS